jgi:Family of unknown function (DUF5996)
MSVRGTPGWPAVSYEHWPATCDTLHAHTQVLGKIALRLARPEPQLLHAALRLTARGWETAPLPAPDGSGALVVALDLRAHEAVVEHTGGACDRIPLTPDRAVKDVTRDVLAAVRRVGCPVDISPQPQEVPWTVPLDRDDEHAHYDPERVRDYLLAATRAAQVLEEFRAPYRGRSTPVLAWWGAFDLAVSLFSGAPADPPSRGFITRNSADAQAIAVGWWPGDATYPREAFYAYAHPAPAGVSDLAVTPRAARWVPEKGEFLLHCDDLRADPDPDGAALAFARSFLRRAGTLAGWDEALLDSAEGRPPPVR